MENCTSDAVSSTQNLHAGALLTPTSLQFLAVIQLPGMRTRWDPRYFLETSLGMTDANRSPLSQF